MRVLGVPGVELLRDALQVLVGPARGACPTGALRLAEQRPHRAPLVEGALRGRAGGVSGAARLLGGVLDQGRHVAPRGVHLVARVAQQVRARRLALADRLAQIGDLALQLHDGRLARALRAGGGALQLDALALALGLQVVPRPSDGLPLGGDDGLALDGALRLRGLGLRRLRRLGVLQGDVARLQEAVVLGVQLLAPVRRIGGLLLQVVDARHRLTDLRLLVAAHDVSDVRGGQLALLAHLLGGLQLVDLVARRLGARLQLGELVVPRLQLRPQALARVDRHLVAALGDARDQLAHLHRVHLHGELAGGGLRLVERAGERDVLDDLGEVRAQLQREAHVHVRRRVRRLVELVELVHRLLLLGEQRLGLREIRVRARGANGRPLGGLGLRLRLQRLLLLGELRARLLQLLVDLLDVQLRGRLTVRGDRVLDLRDALLRRTRHGEQSAAVDLRLDRRAVREARVLQLGRVHVEELHVVEAGELRARPVAVHPAVRGVDRVLQARVRGALDLLPGRHPHRLDHVAALRQRRDPLLNPGAHTVDGERELPGRAALGDRAPAQRRLRRLHELLQGAALHVVREQAERVVGGQGGLRAVRARHVAHQLALHDVLDPRLDGARQGGAADVVRLLLHRRRLLSQLLGLLALLARPLGPVRDRRRGLLPAPAHRLRRRLAGRGSLLGTLRLLAQLLGARRAGLRAVQVAHHLVEDLVGLALPAGLPALADVADAPAHHALAAPRAPRRADALAGQALQLALGVAQLAELARDVRVRLAQQRVVAAGGRVARLLQLVEAVDVQDLAEDLALLGGERSHVGPAHQAARGLQRLEAALRGARLLVERELALMLALGVARDRLDDRQRQPRGLLRDRQLRQVPGVDRAPGALQDLRGELLARRADPQVAALHGLAAGRNDPPLRVAPGVEGGALLADHAPQPQLLRAVALHRVPERAGDARQVPELVEPGGERLAFAHRAFQCPLRPGMRPLADPQVHLAQVHQPLHLRPVAAQHALLAELARRRVRLGLPGPDGGACLDRARQALVARRDRLDVPPRLLPDGERLAVVLRRHLLQVLAHPLQAPDLVGPEVPEQLLQRTRDEALAPGARRLAGVLDERDAPIDEVPLGLQGAEGVPFHDVDERALHARGLVDEQLADLLAHAPDVRVHAGGRLVACAGHLAATSPRGGSELRDVRRADLAEQVARNDSVRGGQQVQRLRHVALGVLAQDVLPQRVEPVAFALDVAPCPRQVAEQVAGGALLAGPRLAQLALDHGAHDGARGAVQRPLGSVLDVLVDGVAGERLVVGLREALDAADMVALLVDLLDEVAVLDALHDVRERLVRDVRARALPVQVVGEQLGGVRAHQALVVGVLERRAGDGAARHALRRGAADALADHAGDDRRVERLLQVAVLRHVLHELAVAGLRPVGERPVGVDVLLGQDLAGVLDAAQRVAVADARGGAQRDIGGQRDDPGDRAGQLRQRGGRRVDRAALGDALQRAGGRHDRGGAARARSQLGAQVAGRELVARALDVLQPVEQRDRGVLQRGAQHLLVGRVDRVVDGRPVLLRDARLVGERLLARPLAGGVHRLLQALADDVGDPLQLDVLQALVADAERGDPLGDVHDRAAAQLVDGDALRERQPL